ncbi:MAG: hypothetical protein AAGA46_03305 [Cyanobacteria bacterium P01_F01_bin.13]
MGESKRRQKLDPNYGKTPDLLVSAFCQICIEGTEGGKFQRHVDAALGESIDLHQDLLLISLLEAVLRFPSVGAENMKMTGVAEEYIAGALNAFERWGLNPTEEAVNKGLAKVQKFLDEKVFSCSEEMEQDPRAATESFFKKYAYVPEATA